METPRKLKFRGDLDDCHICPQGKLKHFKLSRRTFNAQQLLERVHSDIIVLNIIEGYWREKMSLWHVKILSSGHWNPDL